MCKGNNMTDDGNMLERIIHVYFIRKSVIHNYLIGVKNVNPN